MNSPTRSGRSSRTPTQAVERSVPSPDGFSQVASSRARSGFAMPHQGLFIPFYGTSLLCAVLDAQQDASTVGLYEDFAAQKIQATFRMYCERCRFLHTKRSVETIQRLYRGHKERMSVHAVRSSGKEAFQLAMFDYYASRIQACFRGFWHRLHVDSFYAKKRYLHEVTTQSYEVLGMAQRATEEQSATMATEKRAQENHKYVRATERAHHVLSTSSISGVYRRAPGESGERTVWATNVEEDIRINATNARKAVLQRKLDSVHASTRTSPSAMHSHGTSPSPAKKAEGKQSPQLIVFSPTNGDGVEASSPGSRSVATPQRDPTGEANISGVMAPNSASGGGDGAGATGEEPVVLPPIRPTRKEHQRAIHTIPCSSLKPTCYWEAEEAQPRQRPVIAPVHCATVKDARDTPYTRAANKRAESFALRGLAKCEATWPMVSSFHPTFDTPAHDCVEAGAVSTYDGEIAKVRRDVNSKMIQSLHGKAPFKVPASGR